MTHPPTQCDRTLIFTPGDNPKPLKISRAEIIAQLREYWQRSDEIWQKLPLTIEGETFTHWWQMDFENHVLPLCRAQEPRKRILEAYVYLPLLKLFKGLRERAGP